MDQTIYFMEFMALVISRKTRKQNNRIGYSQQLQLKLILTAGTVPLFQGNRLSLNLSTGSPPRLYKTASTASTPDYPSPYSILTKNSHGLSQSTATISPKDQ